MGKSYPVGIVGESNYQRAIGQTSEGDPVTILLELDNPYSKTGKSLRVENVYGDVIGYIADDHWLKSALVHERQGCQAVVLGIEGNPIGVILEVCLGFGEIPMIPYGQKSRSARSGKRSITSLAESIWKRFV
ncbi:MAG: hypothetical protein AAGE37_00040 [Pseudomonadota bacterium]